MTEEEWTAVRLSLLVAVTATAASLPFGVAIAWLLARKRFWGKSLVDTLVHLPLIWFVRAHWGESVPIKFVSVMLSCVVAVVLYVWPARQWVV